MKFLPSVRAVKTWARQITTAVGMAGGFSVLRHCYWRRQMDPGARDTAGIIYLLAHPERVPRQLPEETVKQIGEALKAVADRASR